MFHERDIFAYSIVYCKQFDRWFSLQQIHCSQTKQKLDSQYLPHVLQHKLALSCCISSHRDMVFLASRSGDAVDRRGVGQQLRLRKKSSTHIQVKKYVHSAIMKPLLRPPCLARKVGRPDIFPLTQRAFLAELNLPSVKSASAVKSPHLATYSPWKLPAETKQSF